MRKIYIGIIALVAIGCTLIGYYIYPDTIIFPTTTAPTTKEAATPTPTEPDVAVPTSYLPAETHQVYQTFNNCGPAALSMLLAWHGITESQDEIGLVLRPNQNQQGIDDDKSTPFEELAQYAKEKHALSSVHKPNGTLELLKKFTSQGMPVAMRTLLSEGDDIGHFRIVKGYDDETGIILQDDSYDGPNISMPYAQFMSLWQPFSYEYLVLIPPGKERIVNKILGEESDTSVAWANSLKRARAEQGDIATNPYPYFNEARASYYTGDYESAVRLFEQVKPHLPRRTLWYQLEPLVAYQKLGRFDVVLSTIADILSQGNAGYSELYLLRGQVYEAQGRTGEALAEYRKAVQYNVNLPAAREAVARVQ